MDLQNALALLLGKGMTVIYRGWHLYPREKCGFMLLHLDAKSNVIGDDEKIFENAETAISAFVAASNLSGE